MAYPKTDSEVQLSYAETMGLGQRKYTLMLHKSSSQNAPRCGSSDCAEDFLDGSELTVREVQKI